MTTKKSAFSELLTELGDMDQTMAKSFGDGDGKDGDGKDKDDEKIQAAADGDRDGDGTADGKEKAGGDGGEGKDGDDDDEEEMAKALGVKPMTIKDGDGKEQQAYDGLQMLKAMFGKVRVLGAGEEDMLKAVSLVGGALGKLMKHVQKQDTLIKTLQEQVNAMGNKGGGRKAVLQVLNKSFGGEGDGGNGDAGGDGEMNGPQILAKAQLAVGKGLISAIEVAHVERTVSSGLKPAPEVMAKINQA